MASLSEDFEAALEQFGPPLGGIAPGSFDTSRFRGKIPDSLLDFWDQHGLGLWLDGYFQVL